MVLAVARLDMKRPSRQSQTSKRISEQNQNRSSRDEVCLSRSFTSADTGIGRLFLPYVVHVNINHSTPYVCKKDQGATPSCSVRIHGLAAIMALVAYSIVLF